MIKFRDLKANEIYLRVGNATKKGVSLLLYKDARCDMNILDECVGAENWQRDHKEVKGNLYCGVSIWDDDKKQWITKWDCGTESYSEKEKGEASDSFKRACFNWGIGKELYTSPFIWLNLDTEEKNGKYVLNYNDTKYVNSLYVSEFECTDKVITTLEICDRNDNVVFSFGVRKEEKAIDNKITEEMKNELIKYNVDLLEVAKYCKVTKIDDIPKDYARRIISKHRAEEIKEKDNE